MNHLMKKIIGKKKKNYKRGQVLLQSLVVTFLVLHSMEIKVQKGHPNIV